MINRSLRLILGKVALFICIDLLWRGVEWLTAGEDKSKPESARQKIPNAIIGLAIVASAFAIAAVINRFFGTSVGGSIEIPQGF